MSDIKNRFKRILLGILCLTGLLLPVAPVAAQDIFHQACQGVSDSTLCEEKEQDQSHTSNSIYGRNGIITKATRLLSFVVGIAAVIAIIIGGFKYITSSGDSNNVNSAKNTILFAVIGLLVATVAQALIIFVLNRL